MLGANMRRHGHSYSLESNTSQPSSLAYSAHSEDTCIDGSMNMATDERVDVNLVLDDVIIKINRITDHLRDAGENEAANRFTKEMTSTLRNLYNIIAPWDIEQCLMKVSSQPQTSGHARNASETSQSAPRNIAAPSPGTTWAAIAATEPVTDKNGIIKFRPSDGLQFKAPSEATSDHPAARNESDRRVVWIRPWTATRSLSEITGKMQTVGAIYSMAYAPEATAVCIIFQKATYAADFMDRCILYVKHNHVSPFGPGHDIAPGLPYLMTRDLARMDGPHMERRRLTFARSGLFNSNGVSQQRFRHDIEEVVGSSNVELLWFFNSGNATAVFSAVPLARLVRDTFLQCGRSKVSPYYGIMVGYSHDPCERDMHLVSQIPGHPGYIGGGNNAPSGMRPRLGTVNSNGSGGGGYRAESPLRGGVHKRRNTNASESKSSLDDDGWQTVKKRR